MSTVHSTPSPAGQRPYPIGFNEQTSYDPFFPSSPSEEQLVPIECHDHLPANRSYHSPTPLHPTNTSQGDLQKSVSPSDSHNHLQPPPHTASSNAFHTLHPDGEHEATNDTYDFLSPNAYMSDNGYSGTSENTTTPDYGENAFYLEDNFGILSGLNQNFESNEQASFQNSQPPQPCADTHSPHEEGNLARHSSGTATLDSHLMSPVATDPGDRASRQGTNSPRGPPTLGKSESAPPFAAPMLQHVAQGNMDPLLAPPTQITPTETDSSKIPSPNIPLNAVAPPPNIARAASPVIRLETYSRGDSPARGARLAPRSTGKRSRSGSHSSHLAVHEEDESDEDDGRNDDFSGTLGQGSPRIGLDPEARLLVNDTEVPNFKEQEDRAQLALKKLDVEEWLERSEPSDDGVDAIPRKPLSISRRVRARSAGAQSLSLANLATFQTTTIDSHIPGPGVLINEESGDEEINDDENEGASIDEEPLPTVTGEPANEIPGEAKPGNYYELPNQPPLYRAKLWQDPLYGSSDPGIKLQPATSNDAIMRFHERAGDIETLSRAATCGSRRRSSESDLESLFHRVSVDSKISGQDRKESLGSLLQQAAARLVPKRSSSNLRKGSESPKVQSPKFPQQPGRLSLPDQTLADQRGRKDSLGVPQASPTGLRRMSSLGKRPKSPRINTGSAVAAIAFQTGALGAGGSLSATATSSPTGWQKIKRGRSSSDLNGAGPLRQSTSATNLGIADLWTKQGGPPMPTLAAPPKNEEAFNSLVDPEDDDDDDATEDHGVKMDLSIRPDSIVPTLDGFKVNVRQLNPRLPPFMFDRIAQEQLRRFKKLMDFKIKHIQALSQGKCPSGKYCLASGGEPTYLPSKSNIREPELSHTGFSVAGLGQSDEDVNVLAEGIVTPAQFPSGVPMPPVKRLPAEFECSLCFKVKKFHKPSDWSKHVHEDVQPFTCTFATCAEPKSFKRKADWVRHENERHRQLEWWMCNMNDCSHKCYRKDNFVQHLVREHKLPEPKVKTAKNGKPAVRGPSSQKARIKHSEGNDDSPDEIDQVWKLVEDCRHETPKNPKDEACKFCGNVCNSWKKLTVHLAKHMEQISMPVLGVVKHKEVTADTIISPIEQRLASQNTSLSPIPQSPFSRSATGQSSSLSPFGVPSGSSAELNPGAFSPLSQPQSGYFGTPEQVQAINYQRVSPATYPPPGHSQRMATNYAPNRQSPLTQNPMSNFGSYSASPRPQFNPVNSKKGFSDAPTTSPENLYAGIQAHSVPTSQPRASPYDENSGFQYVPQQQQTFASPIQGVGYQFGNATPASFPKQASTPAQYAQQQQRMSPPTSSYPPQRTTPPTSFPQQQMSSPSSAYPPGTTPPTSFPQQQSHMSPPSTSYSQQQRMSVSGPMLMQYNQTRQSQMGQTQDYSQGAGDPSLYAQQQQQQHTFNFSQR